MIIITDLEDVDQSVLVSIILYNFRYYSKVYHVYKSTYNNEVTIMDISKKLAKINKKYDIK